MDRVKIELTVNEVRILLQILDATGFLWDRLPDDHYERRASRTVKAKLRAAIRSTLMEVPE